MDETSGSMESENYVDFMRMRGEPGEEYFNDESLSDSDECEPNNGFYCFYNMEGAKIWNEFPNLIPAEIDVEIVERWNNLDEEARSKYKDMEDIKRILEEAEPAGSMSAYAFFIDTCRKEHEDKYPTEEIDLQEFSSQCTARWNNFSGEEKKRFHEMAKKDEDRLANDLQKYTASEQGDGPGVGEKRVYKKDPSAPKRSLSAFFWFAMDERPQIRAANPEYGVGEVSQELGKRWVGADPQTKAKYEAIAEEDKARYERELDAYNQKREIGELSEDSKKQN